VSFVGKVGVMILVYLKKFEFVFILSCKYRNRRRRYSLRVNLLAAIYNYELGIGIATS
jgi:hypothetical protein